MTVTDAFFVVNPNTTYTLHLQNGGLVDDASDFVSSTVITINGVTVVAPNDLNQNTATLDRAVQLQAGSNTIAVQVRGKPGGQLAISVIGTDTDLPTIQTSVSPTPNGALWNNSAATVTFVCADATSGLASCTSPLTVAAEGAGQVVTGTAVDLAGNAARASVTLNIDETPPVISAAVSPAPVNGIVNAVSATVTFTCSDALSGVLTCPSPVTTTAAGLQTISGTAVDTAGNTASIGAQFTLQPAPPLSVVASISPQPVADWNRTPVTVSFQCSGGVPPVSCPAAQIVNTDGSGQIVTGTAVDAAGGSAQASVTINLDQTAPLVTITSPGDGSVSPSGTVAVSGLASDGLSGLSAVSCNGTPASITGGSFTCSLQIQRGSLAISVQATDVAGNTASASVTTNLQGPKISITSPTALDLFGTNAVTVSGTVDDPGAIVTVNGVQATNSGGIFTAQGVTLREGTNLITATAINAGGGVGTASVSVVLDTTPPTVTIDSPSDRAVVTTPQIMVTGLVNDVVTGTVNAAQVSVTVNGVQATVGNRSFMASNVLLVPGQNIITAVAKDRAGNVSQNQVTITLQDAATQQRIIMVSGNNQSAVVGTALSQPLLVEVVNAIGQALPNIPVTFSVEKSDGQLTAFPQQGRQLVSQTDANGLASVTFQVGSRVGNGNNQVSVTAPGFVGEVMFSASATNGPPANIYVISGGSQKGVVGQPLPEPLTVGVFDAGGNPVSGVQVAFSVAQGGGVLEGNNTVTKTTDSDGRAAAVLVLAQEEGVNNNVVNASFTGLTSSPATFVASGLTPRDPANTTVTGIVLDNADQPIPNATASIKGTTLSAVTDSHGRFTIPDAPVGSLILFIDGSTSSRPEVFPFLEFPIVTVTGQDNNLGGPIYLPPLDVDNSKIVGGDEDVVLTMKGAPGVAYTVFAHSATFPDGSKVGRLTLSQVHADKVPMAPPNGTAPAVVGTLQPARVKFDPPIRIQVPNTSGLLPGQVVEVYSFDHDLEQFVSGGTARVSQDGSVIVSDPGFGLRVSGWHAAPPPPPPKSCPQSCDDKNPCTKDSCRDGACQHDPLDGGSCDDKDKCSVNDRCQAGVCKGDAKKITSVTVKAAGQSGPITKKTKEDIPFTVDAQQENCGGLKYKWDFGDGSTSTDQNPTHQYKEPNKYHVTVDVTCDSSRKCSTQTGSIDVNVAGIKIELCQDQTKCDITAVPQMQSIHVKASVVGVDPDPTASTTFQWNAKLVFETKDCRGSRALGDPAPLSGSSTGGEFDMPQFAQIRGGSLQVTADATVNQVALTGDTKQQKATKDLKIRGTNPARTDIQGRAGQTDLQMIACQESGQRQFAAAVDNGASVCSVWNGGGDGGVGVMQITPARSANDAWNWQINVDGGVSKFSQASGSASRYRNNVLNSGDWANAVAAFNAQRVAQNLPAIPLASVTLPVYTADQQRFDTIRCFNGAGGREFFGAGLHEYRVVRNGTTTAPNGSTVPALALTVNEQARTATGSWERVPTTDRHAGDPCYVDHVLLQSPSCPSQVRGTCP